MGVQGRAYVCMVGEYVPLACVNVAVSRHPVSVFGIPRELPKHPLCPRGMLSVPELWLHAPAGLARPCWEPGEVRACPYSGGLGPTHTAGGGVP